MDILFVNANSSEINYQQLSKRFAAIETPIWAGMLANHMRLQGFATAILDCEAERLDTTDSAKKALEAKARLICFVVYGQNPNDGTPRMAGAVATANLIKAFDHNIKIVFVGPHVAALPREVLAREKSIDFICQNEGVYTLANLVRVNDLNDENLLLKVKGLGFRSKNYSPKTCINSIEEDLMQEKGIILNPPEQVVPRSRLEIDLPGIAWDMLPSLNKYRTSSWHSWTNNTQNTPFASLYTSLGCPYRCHFCMINIINRVDSSPHITSADSNTFRYWDPEFIINQFDYLARVGVVNIKIADELFVLNKSHFLKLARMIKQRGYHFNIWCYSRIDTCRVEYLEILKDAGINWLALGIENPNQLLRREFVKGGFEEVKIIDLIKQIQSSGINVIGNYIYGLPPDTHQSMQETLEFALGHLTEAFNIYPAQALPGSPLYLMAKQNGLTLPSNYQGYSMLSYETQNMANQQLTAADILKARDDAWMTYHRNPQYLALLEEKFGVAARKSVEDMTKIELKRKILGN